MSPSLPTPRALLTGLLLPCALCAQPLGAPVSRDVLKLDPIKISGAGLSANEAAGTEPTEVYGEQDLEESGVFDLGEFFDQLPPSPAGGEQLVLVDGKPTYLDVSQLPPEMIASIEVANHGAMPQYGAFANGRVINIRLKPNFQGEFLGLDVGGAFAGDGLHRRLSFTGMLKRGPLRLTYGANYREEDGLQASDRAFSREQDHTARGGTDLRLLWDDTAVVRAVDGNLAGVLDAAGLPVAVALAPEHQDGRGLVPADFLPPQVFPPATSAVAAGQRRFNSAEYISLQAPGRQASATFGLTRPLSPAVEMSLSGSVQSRRATRSLAPPVTAASGRTVVPAAYNPFGQDVEVGLVHAGFGPVLQQDESMTAQLGMNLNGRLADTWRWRATLGGRWARATQTVADLDREAFAASLADPDPARRFNPFGDDPRNASLYRELTVLRSSLTETAALNLDLHANGQGPELPGGPMQLMVRGEFNDQARARDYANPARPVTAESRRRDNDQSFRTNVTLPWVSQRSPRPGVRRLENQLSAGYSSRSGLPGGSVNGRLGLMWSPHRAFSFRGNYTASRRAPSRFLADATPLAGETLVDPRRSPATATDVQIVERDFEGAVRARSGNLLLSISVEPPFIPGLEFSATYDQRRQDDLTSAAFKPQDLVYNELTLPGRVVRAAPTEDDLRLGQPGRLLSVDTTPSDRASQESSGMSWSLRYRNRGGPFGQFHFNASLRQVLTQRYEVVPGTPFIFESGNDLNRPDWTWQSRAGWSRQGWRVGADFRYVDEARSGTIVQPASRRLGLQLSYRFNRPLWGQWGRGVHVALRLENLIEASPPFADTINGFRSGSPLGRTWALTVRMPLRPSTAPGRTVGSGAVDD